MWRKHGAGGVALRTVAAAVLVVLVVGLGGAVADAATELRVSPASGPPGTSFTVTGSGFAPADVEIHWDSQTGPLLATATGPDFSVEAVVPDSPPNSHPVVSVVRAGGTVSTSSAAFQVTPGAEPVGSTTTTVADPVTPPAPVTADPAAPPATASPPPSLPAGATDASALAEVDAAVAKALAESNASVAAALASVDVAVAGAATATTAPGPPGAGAAPGAPTSSAPPVTGGSGSTPGSPATTSGSPATRAPVGAALPPLPTARSSPGGRPPVMVLVALGLVVGAALVLVVRNRNRFGRPGPDVPADDPAAAGPRSES